jgi:hypothetical protein
LPRSPESVADRLALVGSGVLVLAVIARWLELFVPSRGPRGRSTVPASAPAPTGLVSTLTVEHAETNGAPVTVEARKAA